MAPRTDPRGAREDSRVWPLVKELLADCLEAPPDERERRLLAAEPAVRRRVRSLLTASENAPTGLDRPLAPDGAEDDDVPPLHRLHRVGPYRLGRVLGEGGMGLVYEAFQEQPERTVALKILRPSVVSERTIQRFHAEIEILGRLQHPGIASIFDAGVLDGEASRGEGLAVPWFAMERVDGVPLNRFAADRPLEERLTLLLDVCDAVQYAHQRGVIHRDLKPANLLVSAAGDAAPRVRVLDFGIARATSASGRGGVTLPGLAIGTLPYMSPEQVEGDPAEIDVRTDVYAIGVLLYELLAGRLPLDVGDDPPTVAARRVREEEPAPPSSHDRSIDDDLDTITMHALAKDRDRRYPSVSELAADLRRFRRHEPIVARPPSLGYHLSKLARRHRGLVGGLAAAALLLAVSVTAILVGLERTRVERDKATSVLGLLRDVLTSASPYREGVDVTVTSLLDQAVNELGADHPPEVEATLRRAIGETYLHLGRGEDGIAQLDRAVALLRVAAGPDSPETLEAEVERAIAEVDGTEERLADDRRLLDRCSEILGETHVAARRASIAYADELSAAGRTDAAEERLRADVAALEESAGPDHDVTLEALEALARLLVTGDRLDEAVALDRERIARVERRRGPTHGETLIARGHLAILLDRQGRDAEAEQHHRSLYRDAARLFGRESAQAFRAEEALAQNLVRQRKLDEAEELLVGGIERARRLGVLPQRLNSLAVLFSSQGRVEEAEEHARRAYESTRVAQGEEAAATWIAYENWASVLSRLGRTEESIAIFRESLAYWRDRLGDEHQDLIAPLNHLGNTLAREQRWAEAEPLYRQAATLSRRHLHEDHLLRVTSISSLGICLASLGRDREAEPLLAEGVEAWDRQPENQSFRGDNVRASLERLRARKPSETP